MVVDIVVSCYFPGDAPEREDYAKLAVSSLAVDLSCSSEMRLILADDTAWPGSNVVDELIRIWGGRAIYTHSFHNGIGASLNTALAQVSGKGIWMYTTDDWLLTEKLDLDGPIRLLQSNGYDLVRLGPVHPDLMCVTRFQAGLGWWLDLRQEYGGFAFATRPFIATKSWYDRMGPFNEHMNSYETERLYAERVAKSTSKIAYWGGIDLAGPWEHLGTVNVGYREVA